MDGLKICIIILNFNGGEKTIRCIKSIMASSYSDYQIVVVDNHSTDDSVERITAFLRSSNKHIRFPEKIERSELPVSGNDTVILFRSEKNGGYAFGNNLGMRYAKSNPAFSHMMVLNNDTYLFPDFFQELVALIKYLKSKKPIERMAIGACELNVVGRKKTNGFLYLNLLTGYTSSFPVIPFFRYITGSCIILPVSAPYFDESYFLYFEDTQYSRTLKSINYSLCESEELKYIHNSGANSELKNEIKKIALSGMDRFFRINYPWLHPIVILNRMIIYLFTFKLRLVMHLLKTFFTNAQGNQPEC